MTQEGFIANYRVSDETVQEFEDYFNSFFKHNRKFVAYREEIRLFAKAVMAEQLFGTEAYTQIANVNDNMIEKVKDLLEQSE